MTTGIRTVMPLLPSQVIQPLSGRRSAGPLIVTVYDARPPGWIRRGC